MGEPFLHSCLPYGKYAVFVTPLFFHSSVGTWGRVFTDSGVPPVFEKALEGQDSLGLSGYTEPYVIMEKLATDFPDPLTTKIYTSAYAERNHLQPTSEEVYQFPDGVRLETIVQRFQIVLRDASVPYVRTPEIVEMGTEVVTFKYKPRYASTSPDFKNFFLPPLYGALGLVIQEFQGRSLNETKPQ